MDNSPLCKITPELRNRIYAFALGSFTEGMYQVNLEDDTPRLHRPRMAIAHGWHLTMVCRQIRNDSLDVFWRNVSVHVVTNIMERDGCATPIALTGVESYEYDSGPSGSYQMIFLLTALRHWLTQSGISGHKLKYVRLDLDLWEVSTN